MTKDQISNSDKPLYALTIGEYIELNRQIFSEAQKIQVQTNAQDQDEVLSIEQASKLLNLAKPTIYGLTSKNQIPFIKKGKKLYFVRSELIAWLVEGRQETNAELVQEIKQFGYIERRTKP